jgi:hypothetical protein
MEEMGGIVLNHTFGGNDLRAPKKMTAKRLFFGNTMTASAER